VTTVEIYAELTDVFREWFGDETITLTPQTTASDVDGWDSFNHLNIMVAIEIRFGIKMRTREIESLKNVGEIVSLILTKRGMP
jgi:acyl carrier protein